MFEKQVESETSKSYRLDVSALLDLQVPKECIEGIEANCELMRIHARQVESFEIPSDLDEGIDD